MVPETKFEYRDNISNFNELPYVADRFSYRRWPTREVKVGDLAIGADNPIRVQSMTVSDTQNVKATVEEAERMAKAGCELVRITAPSQRDAECLKEIRQELFKRNCRVPLCADIHFTPKAALLACEYVEKVRVNPGNFADKKVFAQREYSDQQYQEELERIYEKFSPLVLRAKELGRVLRIGTNHGSLSDRIMNRYGDTPLGMVESAMEFVEISRHHGFHDLVISMKASNPKVMIQAYRLLVARMQQAKYHYPLHLGVTEAGAGQDGRLKSAVGIGSLLEDGLGDTVRVSLTESPLREIPVCYDLIRRYCRNPNDPQWKNLTPENRTSSFLSWPRKNDSYRREKHIRPYTYERLPTEIIQSKKYKNLNLGGSETTRVQIALADLDESGNLQEVNEILGLTKDFHPEKDSLDINAHLSEPHAEMIEIPLRKKAWPQQKRGLIQLTGHVNAFKEKGLGISLVFYPEKMEDNFDLTWVTDLPFDAQSDWLLAPVSLEENEASWNEKMKAFMQALQKTGLGIQFNVKEHNLPSWAKERWGEGPEAYAELMLFTLKTAKELGIKRLLSSFDLENPVAVYRMLADRLRQESLSVPLLLREAIPCIETPDDLRSACVFGALLCDGIGDVLSIRAHGQNLRSPSERLRFAFNLLQATENRITKTEFVSCPSCGRTLFDLEETTERIRSKLGHLKGVKLAIMGCIVNGPGEMADAHFGYVGAGPGRINLYVGKECVQKNIPSSEADDRLINLIRDQGMWVNPPAKSS